MDNSAKILMKTPITLREIIIQELTMPSNRVVDSLEQRLISFIHAFCSGYQMAARADQNESAARAIAELEKRLTLQLPSKKEAS